MARRTYTVAKDNATITGFLEAPPRLSEWHRFRRVFFSRKIVLFGMVILIALVLTAIFANWLAPFDPYKPDMSSSLQQLSKEHLLGTDIFGRDTLSRLIYGSRTALAVGFISVGIASVIGILSGIIAGYFGGITNIIIMRAIDTLMPFPMIVLALIVAGLLGGGIHNVIIALSIATIPPYTRVTHGLALSIKENDYILAQRSMGSSHLRIMMKHILPNAFPPIIVLMTMMLGSLILAEAGLSFLGIGIEPPGAAWGAMVNDGYKYLQENPVLSFAPGLAIMLVVFAFNMVGDGLRDALDPRLRGLL
jgi:peptide/nickel transport system permease protein/oligopeptide transport system permease protein